VVGRRVCACLLYGVHADVLMWQWSAGESVPVCCTVYMQMCCRSGIRFWKR